MIKKITSSIVKKVKNTKNNLDQPQHISEKADYPSFKTREAFKSIGAPYFGGYPVELDGLTDDNLSRIEKCQITNCKNPINNSCIIEASEHDPLIDNKQVYHICDSHSSEDVMNDKIYEKCKRCKKTLPSR